MGYNVARNPIGMVPNVPIAYTPDKDPPPLIFITLSIHEGHFKRDRELTYLSFLTTFQMLQGYY